MRVDGQSRIQTYITIGKDFCDRLRILIEEELNISQTEFSHKVGISKSYLSMLLAGKRGPSAELMAGIFPHYREYCYWLLTGRPDPGLETAKGGPANKKATRQDQGLSISAPEIEERLSEAGSAIKDMGKQIEELRAAPIHRCVDLGLLKDLLDIDSPPEGVEERRRFMRGVKKALHAEPAYQKRSAI